jgi:hypothetical protein
MKLKVVGGADYEPDEPETEMSECAFEAATNRIEATITDELIKLCGATDESTHPAIGNSLSVVLFRIAACLRAAAVCEQAEQELERTVH